jgi:hypothetical protein
LDLPEALKKLSLWDRYICEVNGGKLKNSFNHTSEVFLKTKLNFLVKTISQSLLIYVSSSKQMIKKLLLLLAMILVNMPQGIPSEERNLKNLELNQLL